MMWKSFVIVKNMTAIHSGTESTTDMYGIFTLDLDVEEYHDGAELILNVRNENFSHIIDISEMRNSSQNFVANDIQLLQSRPPAPILSGFTCGLIIFLISIRDGSRAYCNGS